MSVLSRIRPLLVALLLLAAPLAPAAAADKPRVYVILWFDTEDYLLPASDDAALHVADFLSNEGVRATFKVVGEKARTLEKRERKDVIAALKKHEIGYHSNYHSVQPSPAMYLSDLSWDEGVAEFDRRERPGYDDVKRVFGRAPSCYGQPGSSWGPQVMGAMRQWGMPVYLDAGNHVRLDDKPYYYGGLLNIYKMAHQLRADLNKPGDLPAAEDRFLSARKKLLDEGGGMVSIFYHPCEFVHKEFWDGVNFKNGANPPREQWKAPPQKTADETRSCYEVFENYVRFLKHFDDVRFVTATEAAKLYRDKARGRKFNAADLKALAAGVGEAVGFQKRDDYAVSASEVFALLNDYVVAHTSGKGAPAVELTTTPDGPSNPVEPLTEPVTTDASQFARTAADVAGYLRRHGRVPSSVWLGSTRVPPESYLRALADVVPVLAEGKALPATIEVKPAKLGAAKYVSDDDPKALWGWIIFPKGFRAPAMMQLAKRQAWTLKPALLAKGGEEIMGVGIYLRGRCKGKAPPPPKALLERVEQWARKNGGVSPQEYRSEHGKDRDGKPTLRLRFHPAGGPLEVTALGRGRLCASAKTSPVGLGYHVYLCDLFKRLAAALHVVWEPDEEAGGDTRYFFSGDRAALEREFLQWLQECAKIAHENVRKGGGWYLSMPIGHQYECHGQAVTPMGYRDAAWLAAVAKDPSAGIDVFPWWHEDRGAEYDLNRALHLMWTAVRWRKPITGDEAQLYDRVLALLRDAYTDAPNLNYPWREWREMDRHFEGMLGEDEGLPQELRDEIARRAAAVKKKPSIGYRRHPVRVDLPGAWSIAVPGAFAEEWEDGGQTWSAWDSVCSLWVTTYTFLKDDGTPPSAEETLARLRDRDGERLDYRGEKVIGRAFLEHVEKDEEDEGEKSYWRLCGRSAAPGHLAGFTICYTDPAYRQWAIDTWHTIQHA